MVLGTDSARPSPYGGAPERMVRLRVVGSSVIDLAPQLRADEETDERYARQVMMFGDVGQRRLAELTVAVVGVGGGET